MVGWLVGWLVKVGVSFLFYWELDRHTTVSIIHGTSYSEAQETAVKDSSLEEFGGWFVVAFGDKRELEEVEVEYKSSFGNAECCDARKGAV